MTSRLRRDLYDPLFYDPLGMNYLTTNGFDSAQNLLRSPYENVTPFSPTNAKAGLTRSTLQTSVPSARHPIMPISQPFQDLYDTSYDPYLINTVNTNALESALRRLRNSMQSLNNLTTINPRVADPSEFRLVVNVKNFQKNEIDVRIVDGYVIVSAKHDEHLDEHGLISRSFTRRYKLPNDVNSELVTSILGWDGVLTIKAPRKEEEGIVVPIEMEQPQMVEEGLGQNLMEETPVPKMDSEKVKQ